MPTKEPDADNPAARPSHTHTHNMPKVELNDIRIAVSPLTNTVFAGVLDKKDKTLSTWLHHHDVTPDFLKAMVSYLKEAEDGRLELRVKGELRYTITLVDHRAK